MNDLLERKLAIFFRDPLSEPVTPGLFSVLYLLRRDILHCMNHRIILFPATMTIFAGIDLLAKFYAGNDRIGEVRPRFRGYIDAYFTDISDNDSEILYQLRNALLHSFGLFSKSNGKEYIFNIAPTGRLITSTDGNGYIIDPWVLHKKFEKSIHSYQEKVQIDTTLLANFDAMFQAYGTIGIGEISI